MSRRPTRSRHGRRRSPSANFAKALNKILRVMAPLAYAVLDSVERQRSQDDYENARPAEFTIIETKALPAPKEVTS